MSALGALLDPINAVPFPKMTFFQVKEVVKFISAVQSDAGVTQELTKLDDRQCDTLMKVLYVGMANDCKSSSIYFKWHSALYLRAGCGTIMRTLSDKPPISAAPPS